MHEIKLPIIVETGRINRVLAKQSIICVFVFLVMPLIWYRPAFDPDLMPRFLSLTVFLIIAAVIVLVRKYKLISSSAKTSLIIFAATLMWMALSAIKAINYGDAISELLRMSCFGSFLLISSLFFKANEIDLRKIGRFNSTSILIFISIAIAQTLPLIQKYLNHEVVHMTSVLASSLSNKNFFSDVLVMMVPVSLFGLLKDDKKWKTLHVTALLFGIAYIVILQSVSSWLAMMVMLVLFFGRVFFSGKNLVSSNQRRILLIVASATILSAIAFLFLLSGVTKDVDAVKVKVSKVADYISNPALLEQTSDENNNSTFDRILIWRNSIRMISGHPLTGVGLSNWRLVNPSYGIGGTAHLDSGLMNFEHSHNDYLYICSEQGFPGLILYLLFFFYMLRECYRQIKLSENSEQALFIFIVSLSVIAFMVASFFSYPRSRIYPDLLIVFFAAVIFSLNKEQKKVEVKAFWPIIVVVFSAFGLYVSSQKLNADLHQRNLMQSQVSKNYARMIREVDRSVSYFTPLDFTGMPYEWYTGMARLSSGQTDLALDSYRKAYAKNPYQIRLLNDLGTAYDKLNHPDSAIAYYSKALTYSKNCVDCRVNLSSVYFNLGRTKEAFETIDELRTQNIRLKGNESYENALYVITATRLDDSLKTISDTITVNKVSLFLNQRKNLLKAYGQFSTDNGPILPKIFQVASGQISLK